MKDSPPIERLKFASLRVVNGENIEQPKPGAPVPWRIVTGYGKERAVLAANGKTLFIMTDPELACRIVAAVNFAECAYRERPQDS